jgi:predicted RNA binding protein YcfA (HicA-like mRNA interferase family)
MTAREMLRRIQQCAKELNLQVIVEEGRGSHKKVTVGSCQTTIPFHRGEDLGKGLRGAIQRDLAPCLGERWLQ